MNLPQDNDHPAPRARATSQDFGQRWVLGMLTTFESAAAELGELDRQSGDGDFGRNIAAAFSRTREELERAQPATYVEWLTAVSRGFLGTGGTSGPLFGMFFREMARCTDGGDPTATEFAEGLRSGLATVQRYGKADVGHKTMVDALAPAAEAMGTASLPADGASPTPYDHAAQAAVEGAKATAGIIASRGRASYVGEVSRGVLDPGAAAMALMIVCAANAVAGNADVADTSWLDHHE